MARPTTYSGSLVAIYLEGTPADTFVKPCGLTEHQATFSKNMNEVDVPDCDNPDLPAWIEREVSSLDFSASGSGVLAAEAVETWWDAFNTTEPINARIYIGKPDDVANGHYWAGQVHVSQFEVGGTRGERANVSVNVVSHGGLAFHATTAP